MSHLFTLSKTIQMYKLAIRPPNHIESSMVEEEIRQEIGTAILLATATVVPVINLMSLPLVMDRVLNIYEITALNSERARTRELSRNIAYISLVIFLMSSLVFALVLIVQGDTRR